MSILSQPTIIDLCELPQFEGKKITTEGVVTRHHTTSYGSQMINIQSNNSSAVVFLEGEVVVEYGDRIRVTGEVQKYGDGWEIMVDDSRFIELVEKWQNISCPLWQLAENPTYYLGLNVNVSGFVDEIFDDYFFLCDLEEKYVLKVCFSKDKKDGLFPGQETMVAGVFVFDEKNFRYTLKVSDEKHGVFPLLEE
jgi:hypothetical protein